MSGNRPFSIALSALVIAFLFAFPLILKPQSSGAGRHGRALITEKINESKLNVLAGNTRPEVRTATDGGAVPDDFAMEHMMLQLHRAPDQEQAISQFVEDLHNPQSPNFHHWLTAAQFGQKYGASQDDIDTVSKWLQSHGFTVNLVYPSGMLIDFTGTAGRVREAFHTAIHYLDVNGERHVANVTDPQIPAALAPAVAGVVSMHDFRPHAMRRSRSDFTFSQGGSTVWALVPADLATIYDLNPLFNSGISGQGQTIAVIEDTDLYSDADWTTFRSTFNLNQYASGSLSTVHPAPASGTNNCVDPGVAQGDDGEAISDAEWASAAAPNAAIQVASCAGTRSTFGGLIAMQNLVNGQPPAIMSLSYGNCEVENGASANAAYNALYQQAVTEGVSVFVAAGDEGAASCDSGAATATHGIGVSGWASTPYNVAVGGTDFSDTLNNTNSTYWNSTNNPTTYGSAISYIPEIPWDDSCANSMLASSFGFTTTYGPSGFCGSSSARQNKLITVSAGSGGPSGCATGAPTTQGVVSGTCQGYAKPSWQSGVPGIPNDNVRDLPDVSLFAGDGVWGHFYVTCWSDRRKGGAPCVGSPANWTGAGGTSFSSPILAGVQALINQKAGGAQGNPNYSYYQLAAIEYSASTAGGCASSGGGNANCIFHNVTTGDISVNCSGSENCYGYAAGETGGGFPGRGGFGAPGGAGVADGALSLSTQSYDAAYGAAPGWNFTTGIGSIDVYNLVMNWP
jgi:subtilase family serine protease